MKKLKYEVSIGQNGAHFMVHVCFVAIVIAVLWNTNVASDIYVHLQAETKFYNGLLYYGEGGNNTSLYSEFSLWFNILLFRELMQNVCLRVTVSDTGVVEGESQIQMGRFISLLQVSNSSFPVIT